MAKQPKLIVELVPASSWGDNLRSILTRKQWDIIRHQVYDAAWHTCRICGETKGRLDCHESWQYDDANYIQTLLGMIALCPACHQVKHFGFAQIQGKEERALKHLMRVNGFTKKQAHNHVQKAFQVWAQRSTKTWTLDISILAEYGIKIDDEKA